MSDIRDMKNALADIRNGRVLLRLDIALLEEVDKAAARRGISRSAFIRKALQRVIDGEPDVGS